MATIIKIYCRYKDTPKMLKEMGLDLETRSYEETIRELYRRHKELERVTFV